MRLFLPSVIRLGFAPSVRPGHNAAMSVSNPPAPGVGSASAKLVERQAGSPTGAWRPGDDPGGRHFLEIGDMPLESGEILPSTVLATMFCMFMVMWTGHKRS